MYETGSREEATSASSSAERVVVVILLRADGAALLQHRDDKPGLRHAGMWGLPGGHCERGESLEAGARRELCEETNYECGELHSLVSFEDHDDKTCPPYFLVVFWAPYDGRQLLQCREGQAIRFVPRKDADAYPIPGHLFSVWDAAIAAFKKTHGGVRCP